MVVQDRVAGLVQEADAPDDLVPVLRVQLHDAPLLGRERPVLAQHPGGDAEFADVVQDPGEPEPLHPALVHAEFTGDQNGGPADALLWPRV